MNSNLTAKILMPFVIILLTLAIIVAGCTQGATQNPASQPLPTEPQVQPESQTPPPEPAPTQTQPPQQENPAPSVKKVYVAVLGFEPSIVVIKAGDTVVWVNNDTTQHWPASASHPTHTVYPGSDIKKCKTAEMGSIFDACHGLAFGEQWNFTFNEKGTWSYHDHLKTVSRGRVVVE
ncbi:MAG TPA: plastocyanin/azurin family copper-binding protein [Candidatus Nanoarchaeia archaeon]|nr:plastocyanin/azurin family copper-binding protein [Candidatus Nanoarchaeia archaeon]